MEFYSLGAGFTTIGAGIGIGLIGAAALHGLARQPEAAKEIQKFMILGIAFVEGVAFLALVICLLEKFVK